MVDELVVLTTPETFGGVGCWCEDLRQVTDDHVAALLGQVAAQGKPATAKPGRKRQQALPS
jgi:predicted phosphoribosyltransferase